MNETAGRSLFAAGGTALAIFVAVAVLFCGAIALAERGVAPAAPAEATHGRP